jgi:CRISPR/Cas system-associated protein Csm6
VDAILQASISANKEVYDNVREVINMSDVVREFFQPAFDKAVKEEAAKVAAEKAEEMAREIAEEKAKEIAEEKAKEIAEEKVEENAVEFIKAIMDSLNIDVDEAMDKLKISESSRDMLKKKIVATM